MTTSILDLPMNRPKILVVDDDASMLEGLRRQLATEFDVTCASDARDALSIAVCDGPFEVAISDMRMPEINGVELFEEFAKLHPAVVRILLTGFADVETAIAAVNRGEVFRFLSKPCDVATLRDAARDGVVRHRLMRTEDDQLGQMRRGRVEALLGVLSLSNPAVHARAVAIKNLASEVLATLGEADRWDVEVAAMLSQFGAVTLPEATFDKLQRGFVLDAGEKELAAKLPQIVDDLLSEIPGLDCVREIIAEHVSELPEARISRNGCLLRLVVEFEAMVSDGQPFEVIFAVLRLRHDGPAAMIISALESGCIVADLHRDVAEVSVEQLRPGMAAMTPHESDHDKVANATDATARSMQMQWFPVNAHAAPKAFVVVAALPAVVPEDVMIELGPGILRIWARLRSSGPRGYVLHEWEYGGYEREIDVPQGFGGSLKASLTNGQLVVRVMRGAFTRQVSAQPHPA